MTTGLAAAAWPTLPDRPLVLVPVGSTEQHGPHLPLHTDTVIAIAVAERVAHRFRARAAEPEVLVAPAIAYGASGEHQDFPGTVSVGTPVLTATLVELVRSLSHWAAGVVLVNGHGGNVPALRAAVSQVRSEGHHASWVPCGPAAGDAHAGHVETSVMLHLAQREVAMDRATVGNTRPLGQLMPDLVRHGVRALSPTGVLGDPRGATAEAGASILGAMVDDVYRCVGHGVADAAGRLVQPDAEVPVGLVAGGQSAAG
ncbi:mycofactocin biosynthesis peptidyl-dipeptidase MftE [Nocardioides sp. zg-579]|uniref:Mycofactocin biosynthesis peptidyl-dipeptidase MftE n=1 Tax=Nocardioides marmotae TaxID=2663857 RepID=A0A6I3IXE2_9ACTN|nr:mycofactocin biosynthesis peptidyl-dipeptidase MftE [Nocardioides marmotae]MCR6030126.1 mycofactocin biosynthesis peptidyl-dipeptidase MftE [Gordonia jinghuaiqii]MTB93757.1 mycofactocin biosynthesis peptidyl-dipeptidase MftE [Nocardioides marmotae]QKE00095.1 mycofactocin biosynthesis peptidyl-dipeptidase MftE [Nocardioides marmotae]